MSRFLISLAAALIIHEAGHYIAALCFGRRLDFRFSWGKLFGKIPIPRFVWEMPEGLTDKQKKITALAGFGLETAAGVLLFALGFRELLPVAAAHLALYRFYAGEDNDFKWL